MDAPTGPLESSCPPVATRFARPPQDPLAAPGMWEDVSVDAKARAAAGLPGGVDPLPDVPCDSDTDSSISLFESDS